MSMQLEESIDFAYEGIDAPQYYDLSQLTSSDISMTDTDWFDARRSSIMPASFPQPPPQSTKQEHKSETTKKKRDSKEVKKEKPKMKTQTQKKQKSASKPLQVLEGDSASNFPVRSVKALTEPKEFVFNTSMRVRPSKLIPTEEKERMELEKIQAKKFKALPLNKKILESAGELGVPCVAKRPLTQPETPKLLTKQRASKRRRVEEEVSAKENQNPKPRKKKKEKDFVLRTEVRGASAMEQFIRRCHEEREREKQRRTFKARPLPEAPPFQPAPSQQPLTEPELPPLKTEERGALKETALEAKLRKQEEEERMLREFHARPLALPPAFVPAPSDRPLTEPALPPLRTEERGAEKVATLQEKLRKQEEEEQRMREFRALEFKNLPPFVPQKSTKALTTLDSVVLHTDERAVDRSVFDERIREQERLAEEARQMKELEDKMREEQEVKELRKLLVHRPQPILLGKPLEVKSSSLPLTEPQSPFLLTKRRVRAKPGLQQSNRTSHFGRDI